MPRRTSTRNTPAIDSPAEEVVETVTDQGEIGEGLPALGEGAMAMMPVEELLEREEDQEPQRDPPQDDHHRHAG
jgi:hypothetical protein